MVTIETAQELLQGGYFRDALELLRQRRPPRPTAKWLSVEAEALERTGRVREALEVAEMVSTEATDPVATAQAFLVLGVIAREQGRAAYSVECLRTAYDAARLCEAHALAARALSRLLLSEFEDQPDFDVDKKLHACTTEVERWADAATVAALQAFASEAYAKRGRLMQARRCLSIAECSASSDSNPWLNGLVAVARFCVSYLEMDMDSAEESAVEALRQAQISGHVRTELAAIINLAHVWMHRRRYDDAERALRRALAMCDISARVRDYTTEGLARLQLLRGDYLASGRLMEEATTVGNQCGDSYSRAWGLVTHSEVFLQSGRFDECEAMCKEGLKRAERVGGSSLVMQLYAILADCYTQQGRLELAEAALAKVRVAMTGSPLGVIAAMSSRMARTLEDMGLAVDADVLRRRVARIERRSNKPSVAEASWVSGLESNASGDAGAGTWSRVVDRIVALCEQVADTHLIVAEIVEALQEAGCCAKWSLVERKRSWNCGSVGQGRLQVLSLPGNGTLDLAVDPGTALHAQRVVAGIGRILSLVNGAFHTERVQRDVASTASGMAGVLELARRAAGSDVPVLLLGETGVGKEWLSRQIHSWSKRSRHRFVGFNCSAVPKDMLDAQLFGHRKGAFTGAHESAIGVVRAASGGTLLLDEVAELSPEVQVKLLRFLEGSEVHPIGESVPVSVDVRVLAATNADPGELMRRGVLRKDLYYRLNVITIRIPPLRERRDEIGPLAEHFLLETCRKAGRRTLVLSHEVRDLFLHYSWPGNVRQLMNEVRRCVALTQDADEISVSTLSDEVRQRPRRSDKQKSQAIVSVPLDQSLDHATTMVERAAIVRALEVSGGRRDSAAALLGVSRKGLYLKCRRHGLDLNHQLGASEGTKSQVAY